jgi:hypothetical protein
MARSPAVRMFAATLTCTFQSPDKKNELLKQAAGPSGYDDRRAYSRPNKPVEAIKVANLQF